MVSEKLKDIWRKKGLGESEVYKRVLEYQKNNSKPKPFPEVNCFRKPNCLDLCLLVTNRCCYSCEFCPNKNNQHEDACDINLEDLEKFLIDARKRGYAFVALTGGEPCLHPRFKELIKLLVEYNMRFSFVSNGRFWEKYKFCLDYKKHLSSIAFSLDGDKEMHDSFRGKGAFDKVIEALTFFHDKVETSIHMEVNNRNYKEITNVIEIIKRFKGLKGAIFPILFVNKLILSDKQVFEIENMLEKNKYFINKLPNREVSFGIFRPSSKINPCEYLTRRQITINPHGEAILCCSEFGMGEGFANIREHNVFEILKRKKEICCEVVNKTFSFLFDTNENYSAKDHCSLCRIARGIYL